MKEFIQSIKIFIILSIVCGIIYPLAVTGFAYLFCKDKAQGGILSKDGKAVGALLIAQPFSGAGYFWPRPSAGGYETMSSMASNLTPTGQVVKENMAQYKIKYQNEEGLVADDMLFTSASGLDPHITPVAAYLQAKRIAQARNMQIQAVNQFIQQYTQGRGLGFLGEPRVNVLALNLAMDNYAK